MSFHKLRAPIISNMDNSSAPRNLTQLPTNILEAVLPGYSVISGFILEFTGFDISIVVSLSVLLFTFVTAWSYCYKYFYGLMTNYMTAAISIPSHDDIHNQVISWVSKQSVAKGSRSMRAKSKWQMGWDSEDDLPFENAGPGANNQALLNFSNWEAKVPPTFEPHNEFSWFRHNGNFFRLTREKESVLNNRAGFNMVTSDETLTITVFGRSIQPIKDLIKEARDASFARERSKTTVRRPGPREYRSRGIYAWSKVATRPSRPIETVVLDSSQKNMLLMDINEYLHPATPRWYANRGIPYRRGYLFHGSPGTGKTSLSFAIAGVFGLDIYCISLLEPSLTEEDLGQLFNSLPRRCVVLLEDIDTAGISRGPEESESAQTETKDGSNNVATNCTLSNSTTTKEPPRVNNTRKAKGSNGEELKGISLSGLLNAIDGVASHEGRVLVMTTNHPEKLDDALIRPGRVDMTIEFTLANKEQIREIFLRMYSPDKMLDSLPSHHDFNIAQENSNIDAVSRTTGFSMSGLRKICGFRSNPGSGTGRVSTAPPEYSMAKPEYHKLRAASTTPPETTATTTGFSEDRGINNRNAGADNSIASTMLELNHLAHIFADDLPEYVFSPAEIQGFLLTRKREPRRAVEEVTQWRDNVIGTRNKRHPVILKSSTTAVSKEVNGVKDSGIKSR